MKLNLSVLKSVLLSIDEEDYEKEWINNNIGDGEVSIEEWLEIYSKYWNEIVMDNGDSDEIEGILVNDYKLSDEECDEVMNEYWGDNELGKIVRYNYDEYRIKF